MPLEVVIVRHAIAFERDRARWPDDGQRPLTPEGKAKFRRAARGLARWLGRVDRVLTSPLVRARETAAILTQVARWPKAVETPELSPDQAPSAVVSVLGTSRAKRVAMVGHEPALGMLLGYCVAGADAKVSAEFKKGGVAIVRFARKPQAGTGTLIALVPPRVLRNLL